MRMGNISQIDYFKAVVKCFLHSLKWELRCQLKMFWYIILFFIVISANSKTQHVFKIYRKPSIRN